MFFAYTIALFSIFVTFASAISVARASTGKCHTIDSGYLAADFGLGSNEGNKALDLNSEKELTYKNGTAVKVAFQACPEAPEVGYHYSGRLAVQPTSSNKCLTITNPSSSIGPYFVKSEKCTSSTKPSVGQLWGYGDDFGNVIFWGGGGCNPGILVNLTGNDEPELASRNRLQFTCHVYASFESLAITKTKG